MKSAISIFWFRRDLRLEDNAGLYHALRSGYPVLPIFIFDRNILDRLDNREDRRVEFIHQTIGGLQEKLGQLGSSMEVFYGHPPEIWRNLLKGRNVAAVFANSDYEPYAIERDEEIKKILSEHRIAFHTYKDQVIFEKDEILKDDGDPYTVFTPYSRRWRSQLTESCLASFPVKKYSNAFLQQVKRPVPPLSSIGFKAAGGSFPPARISAELLKNYEQKRDFPAIQGTSRLGLHLRFGTISIRWLARKAAAFSETYLKELIWRDFFQMVLWHFPQVGKGKAFKPIYELIRWRHDEKEFAYWCAGQTGYPIVDAGMRELNSTGFMHNRVRMIAASFLAKHLLIDWRWGEAYFAEKLLDFDLAANNGNWQWAAGCGCDAAPYFRVFNPALQAKKFDPDGAYVRRWIPELSKGGYPAPIVEHEQARKRALEIYARAVKGTR